jgi:uncharacterized membrane protein
MSPKDDSIEEILKRLKSIDNRLNSIEKFLGGKGEEAEGESVFEGKEGKRSEEKSAREEREEEGERVFQEEKKPRVSAREESEDEIRKKEKVISPGDQERVWINVLNKIGIVALILGVGFFIKLSLPYIGLWGRIAVGLFIGVGLLYLGERLIKNYGAYALGISSCGIVILYFSFYASSVFYDLINPAGAFLMMALVTVLGVLLSLRYDKSVISFIAVIGAFLTPYVFSGGEITPLALVILFLYLTLINAWILYVTRVKNWRWLNILAFSLTAMMLLTTIKYAPESGYPWVFLTFSTLFFALFFYIPKKDNAESLIVLFLNPFLYYFVLWFVTYSMNPYIAGTLALILSAFFYFEGLREEKKEVLDIAWAFTSLAVLFLTIAVPVFFKTNWSTCVWAVEGAIILSLGKKENVLKILSLALLGVAVFKMFLIDYFILEPFPFLFNSTITIAAVFLCAKFLSEEEKNKGMFSFLSISGMILVFWFITWTGTNKFFEKFDNLSEMSSLVISVLWGLYSLILFVAGITKENIPARTAGFIMAALTILKVFFYDFSSLETAHRVLSFIVLGIILLIISFIYQKKIGGNENDE